MKYCRVITLFHYGFVTYNIYGLFRMYQKMAIIYTILYYTKHKKKQMENQIYYKY